MEKPNEVSELRATLQRPPAVKVSVSSAGRGAVVVHFPSSVLFMLNTAVSGRGGGGYVAHTHDYM